MKEKKYFSFNFVFSLILLILGAVTGTDVLMADIGVVDPGKPKASPGQTGASTQLPGQASTVSNLQEASEIVEPSIDEQITMIASDESVLDTIKRRCKRQIQVDSFEVKHYRIDEAVSTVVTNAKYTGSTSVKQAELKIDQSDADVFQEYYTVLAKGVDGYDETGQKKTPGVDLMLYVVGKTSGTQMPIVRAVNGPKQSTEDAYPYLPDIESGTKLVLLSSAGYETQKFIAPHTVTPVPETLYVQKQICNSIVSDYFDAQKKKVPFGQAVIAEAILRQFRLESCRTAWVGQKSKIKVKAQDSKMGEQFAYTSLGVRWQIKRSYQLDGAITFNDLINLSMIKFTGYDCSKKAIWLVGRELLADIQKINITLHKDITFVSSEVFGIKCTKIITVFGEIELVHDPTLDRLGYEKCGALIDEKDLVRYFLKNEQKNSEQVEGEEAKRDIVMTIDCLCLKGYSHIWVDGTGIESGLTTKIVTSSTLPENPELNTVVILTAEVTGTEITGSVTFNAGEVVIFNGSKWVKYTGRVYTVI